MIRSLHKQKKDTQHIMQYNYLFFDLHEWSNKLGKSRALSFE